VIASFADFVLRINRTTRRKRIEVYVDVKHSKVYRHEEYFERYFWHSIAALVTHFFCSSFLLRFSSHKIVDLFVCVTHPSHNLKEPAEKNFTFLTTNTVPTKVIRSKWPPKLWILPVVWARETSLIFFVSKDWQLSFSLLDLLLLVGCFCKRYLWVISSDFHVFFYLPSIPCRGGLCLSTGQSF